MNQNNGQNRGITSYIVILLIILGVLSLVNVYTAKGDANTVYNMEKALDSGLVRSAKITPDKVPPTGSVDLVLESGEVMRIQVTDVAKAEKLLNEYKIYPVIGKAQGESIMTSVVLPLGLSLIAVMIVISIMNRGGGGAGRMANFGKSRARLSLVPLN